MFFDDFQIQQVHSKVVQSDDYYPFGLTFNSYQRENSIYNRYLYNQGRGEKKFLTERIFDLELNIDLTRFRAYDPATGRWWQVDPLADFGGLISWTPYNYSFNSPIVNNDPLGDCPPDDPKCKNGGYFEGRAESVSQTTPYVSVSKTGNTTTVVTRDGHGAPTQERTKIVQRKGANGQLSVKTSTAIHKIATEAKESSVEISSMERSPKEQARVMFEKLEVEGVKSMKDMYGAGGDKVIDAYSEAKGKPADEVMKIMENTINDVGPTKVSKHAADPAKLQVIDIAPSSITNRQNFTDAVNNNLGGVLSNRILPGGSEKAYHLEIPQQ